MFMGKKRKAVMLGVNVFLVLALLWSVVFTVDRKNAAYTNTDIERYKSLNTIPKLGAVTNSRTAEIQFSLYDENLYGIALFFYVSGENTDGELVCSLKHDGETISEQTVAVKELFALVNKNEIKPKELILGNGEVCNGDYTLEVEFHRRQGFLYMVIRQMNISWIIPMQIIRTIMEFFILWKL